VRENCAACVLNGYWPRGDDEWPRDEPNYAGWVRCYIQAGRTIPRKYIPGFIRALTGDNRMYARAVVEDIDAFGARIGISPSPSKQAEVMSAIESARGAPQ
jgi:hypothetical protein